MAFPCFNYSYLAWIGVIPLYLMVMDLRWNRAFIAGFVWGYGWSVASTIWLRNIETFIPFTLSLILAFNYAFWALAVPLIKKYLYVPPKIQLEGYDATRKYLDSGSFLVKELLFVIFLACWWCIIEWIRTWIFTGFPWNLMAITQWQQLGIIQIASVTGIYGVSFIIIFMNLAIANTVINISRFNFNCRNILMTIDFSKKQVLKSNSKLPVKQIKINALGYTSTKIKSPGYKFRIVPISLYAAILLILITFYFGTYRAKELYKDTPKVDLKVAVVQGDIPQIRFYSEEEAKLALKTYTELSEKILPFKPDILIWPESAVPQPLRGGDYLSLQFRNNIASLIRTYKIPILLGSSDYEFKKDIALEVMDNRSADNDTKIEFYNSAFLINKLGRIEKKYNKMHLVPWGEYTPFENLWPFTYVYPWIKKTFGMGRSCTAGTENTIFDLKENIRASVLICYEDVFPDVAGAHVLNGANLLVTITNDAWFPSKDELEQHLAQAVFRAVETNRPMIRNGNCAGTCVIQPNGMITDSIFFKKNSDGKLVPDPAHKGRGTAVFNLSIDKNPKLTFYTKYGNVFILLCGIISFLIFLWCLWNWKDKKSELFKRK